MATDPNNSSNETPSATLTLRMIMQGKEAGSIIGKKGDNVKKFREESGAKINISDSSCPERIVTVTGTTDAIFKAFTMICKKFEEDILMTRQWVAEATAEHPHDNMQMDIQNTANSAGTGGVPKPPVTIRLIVPASQCGSLIGKGGSKIKEIREVTGASIQVASEMLPNSTERTVTISGTADSITQCIYHICCVMLESPPKGATIPYRPKPAMPPVIFAGGQAFTVQGQYAVPSPDTTYARPGVVHQYPPVPQQLSKLGLQQGLLQQGGLAFLNAQQGLLPTMANMNSIDMNSRVPYMTTTGMTQPMTHHNGKGVHSLTGALHQLGHQHEPVFSMTGPTAQQLGQAGMTTFGRANPAAPAANAQTHEMTIPNDLIGCIIGRGGAKINEIRQLSGAQIKIANAEEGSSDRKVTITGTPETINAAQYLINASMEMHKNLTLDTSTPTSTSLTSSPTPLAIPLSQLVKPIPLLGLNMGVLDTAANRKALTTKIKGGISPTLLAAHKVDRAKFAPY